MRAMRGENEVGGSREGVRMQELRHQDEGAQIDRALGEAAGPGNLPPFPWVPETPHQAADQVRKGGLDRPSPLGWLVG